MAATISINFATPEEVFSSTPPQKKSISAKTLNDVLGGGQVSGGYVQRSGSTMTGYLTLVSDAPQLSGHAASKGYVDNHAFTRRYNYTVGITLSANTKYVSGIDNNGARLRFFEYTDNPSFNAITRYVDVYRDGILQVYGDDYRFLNVQVPIEQERFTPPTVEFYSPLLSGSNVAIHIGNKGAFPTVLGVASLSANPGWGIRLGNYYVNNNVSTGDLSISAYPLDFAASAAEMKAPRRNDVMATPINLSAYPLMPKAFGLYRRAKPSGVPYSRGAAEDPYGSPSGWFTFVKGFNLGGLRSGDGFGGGTVATFTCLISTGVFTASDDYTPKIEFSVANSGEVFEYAMGIAFNNAKTPTSFQFTPMTLYFSPPTNVDEVSILVY